MRRWLARAVILLAATLLTGAHVVTRANDPVPLTVHEWGTFTSIAAADGSAVQWMPLGGPQDLPCFVDRLRPSNIKGTMWGTVRMETPVLYFYAPQQVTVNVSVRFRDGLVTEWYPRAIVTPSVPTGYGRKDFTGTISWRGVTIAPGAAEAFPREAGDSHYYAARRTAAAPVHVGSQQEKFLFYRGIGTFAPALSAVETGGMIAVKNTSGSPLGDVVLFENSGGRIRYQIRRAGTPAITLDPGAADGAPGKLMAALERVLVANGLYEAEAKAMIETWRSSWFEEGTRLFYVVPKGDIERILPLQISPAPTSVARVFVGRLELVTAAALRDVKTALATNDRLVFRKYARFLPPMIDRIIAEAPAEERPALTRQMQNFYGSWTMPVNRCPAR